LIKKRKKEPNIVPKIVSYVYFSLIFFLKMTLCQMDAHEKNITNHEKKEFLRVKIRQNWLLLISDPCDTPPAA